MRVVIVDDDTFITGALKTILETTEEITVVGVGQTEEKHWNYIMNTNRMYFLWIFV